MPPRTTRNSTKTPLVELSPQNKAVPVIASSPEPEVEPATEVCSTSFAHYAAVIASRNVPLRIRKRGTAERKEKESWQKLASYHELPDYLQDNEFVQHFYRQPMPVKKSLLSLFGIHNETGNIWTHLLGFSLFLALTYFIYLAPPTPLSVSGHSHVNALLMEVSHQLSSVRANLGAISHTLHLDALQPHLPNLHALHDTLSKLGDVLHHRVDDIVHVLKDDVVLAAGAIRDGLGKVPGSTLVNEGIHALQDGMHAVQDAVHDRLHAVQDGISHQVGSIIHTVAADLSHAFSRVVQWPTPRWPVYVYMSGAMTCLLLSSVCHLLGCCSRHVALMIWRFDYAGIAILIVTSFYPPVYYIFQCQPLAQMFYLVTTSAMGVGTVAVSLLETFQTREWRYVRAGMFTGLASWGVAPLLHAWVAMTAETRSIVLHTLALDAFMGVLYLTGAYVYAMRVPERWLPGRFDLVLNSHQIFHLLIVAAALVHYRAVMDLLAWRDAVGGCKPLVV